MSETHQLSDWHLEVYVGEVVLQCEGVLLHALLAEQLLKQLAHQRASALEGTARFFIHLHGILGHAASVSRLLWAGGDKSAAHVRARAGALRKLLDLPAKAESHPLGLRTLRDHLEHFDERLDKWVHGPAEGRGYVDRNIGPASMLQGLVGAAGLMRNYDQTTGVLSILGDSVNIPALVSAARALRDRAATAHAELQQRPRRP